MLFLQQIKRSARRLFRVFHFAPLHAVGAINCDDQSDVLAFLLRLELNRQRLLQRRPAITILTKSVLTAGKYQSAAIIPDVGFDSLHQFGRQRLCRQVGQNDCVIAQQATGRTRHPAQAEHINIEALFSKSVSKKFRRAFLSFQVEHFGFLADPGRYLHTVVVPNTVAFGAHFGRQAHRPRAWHTRIECNAVDPCNESRSLARKQASSTGQ